MKEEKRTRQAIPSAYNIISSNRSIGYSLDAAIADIIDNSISAEATMIDLISPPGKNPVLFIVDNGTGMDEDELSEALTFGGKLNCQAMRDLKDLGRFGMGLKTASLSQCKCLEVISKKKGKFTGGCWDLDELRKNDKWEYIVLGEEECRDKTKGTFLSKDDILSGTAVIWTKFDRLKKSSDDQNYEFDRLMDLAVKKLELIFHRYLEGEEGLNKLVITYNQNKLKPNNPYIPSKAPEVLKPITVDINKSTAVILPHKLPHPDKLSSEEIEALTLGSSLLETQGFFVYRTKRLIDYGTWFNMASKLEKTKLSRIQIDIQNDQDSEWSLDIKKSHVSPPAKIRPVLRNILEHNKEKSSKTFRPVVKKDRVATPFWEREQIQGKNVHCRYKINLEHPLISKLMEDISDYAKEELKVVLTNIAKFFPFNLVEFDNQCDAKIENVRREIDSEIKVTICFYKEWGFSDDEISNLFPGMEEAVKDYLGEMKK